MHEEWRISIELDPDDSGRAGDVVRELRPALGSGARVAFDGEAIRILLGSQDESERAEIEASGLLDAGDLGYTLWVESRSGAGDPWEPVELVPGLATETVDRDEAEPAEAEAWDGETGFDGPPGGAVDRAEARYEVVLSLPADGSVHELAHRLRGLGVPAAVRGDSIRVVATDAGAAAELSEWLWSEAPAGSRVSTRRISFWRRLGLG